MTENMRKYLELLSTNPDAREQMEAASKEGEDAVKRKAIALAAQAGITLTSEDLATQEGPVDDSDLDAVAGGGACVCVVGGAGTEDPFNDQCLCVNVGSGELPDSQDKRCKCFQLGAGEQ